MPRKFIKRYTPSPAFIQAHPRLRFLGPLIEDPNLFHLNRYSVSTAFLVGVFLAFFPVPGQMALAAMVAFWVRCNLPISVALVWITNPITIPPVFFATYKLGVWLLDIPAIPESHMTFSWEWINSEIKRLWKPLLVGSFCAGAFFSITSYFLINIIWRAHVLAKWRERRQRRKNKAQS